MIVVHVAYGFYSGMLGWFRHYSDNIGSSARYTVYKYSAVGQSAWEDIAGTRHAG